METNIIYLATNTVNGKRYVGLTRGTLSNRWAQHVSIARRKPRSYLHRAIAKYGADVFDIRPIASALRPQYLAPLEVALIADIRPEYNQTHGGEVTFGRKYNDEALQRIKDKNTGKKRTPEQCAANAAQKRRYLLVHPEALAASIAQMAKVRHLIDNEKRVAAVRAANTGRPLTMEHRAKMSATRMGMVYSAEIIARMAASKRKAVQCINTGVTYPCAKTAAEATGVGHRSVIRVLKGEYPAVKGLSFIYEASK